MSGFSEDRWVENSQCDLGWSCDRTDSEIREFHRSLPGYMPTRLVELPEIAEEFGVGHVLVKDESNRFGLPAFKALGASWALNRSLVDQHQPVTFVTASDGNHGRAVAHFAARLGHHAEVFVPSWVHLAATKAIRGEGANVTLIEGSHDDAVAAAREYSSQSGASPRLLVQDTAWEGYEDVPGWIVDGYSSLFIEIDEQLKDLGVDGADLVVVPTGVGSLLQAAICHYRTGGDNTSVVSVEPVDAACVLSSVTAGNRVVVETGETIMAGLNCGTVSSAAWPYIESGLDVAVSVTDEECTVALADLARSNVNAGPCGAASLAAMRTIHQAADPGEAEGRRERLGLTSESTIVLLVTEGAEANPQ